MPTTEAIRKTLETITPGYTSVRWGVVITRWNDREYELGSYGREAVDIDIAVDRIQANLDWDGPLQLAGEEPADTEGSTMKTQELELHIGIEEYIEHLVATGQKPSTVGTAKRSLALFEEALGAKKVIAKIMPVHVAGFFKSEVATTQPGKDGPKPRAEASVLQIRRIVRSALVWWQEQGYLEAVPLPKDERRFIEPRQGKKAKAETATPAAETTEAQPDPAAESK